MLGHRGAAMGRPLDEMALTVTRRPGGWNGAWEFSPFSTLTVYGSRPQPVGPETLQMLPEGARSDARFVIYVDDTAPDGTAQPELYLIGRDREGYAADTIAWNGDEYVLTTIDDWNGRPLGYRAYILLAFAPDEKEPS